MCSSHSFSFLTLILPWCVWIAWSLQSRIILLTHLDYLFILDLHLHPGLRMVWPDPAYIPKLLDLHCPWLECITWIIAHLWYCTHPYIALGFPWSKFPLCPLVTVSSFPWTYGGLCWIIQPIITITSLKTINLICNGILECSYSSNTSLSSQKPLREPLSNGLSPPLLMLGWLSHELFHALH